MPKALFYVMTAANDAEQLACELAARSYSKGQGMVIYCADRSQAERVDELLWQFDAERFIPHNLAGEGPQAGAPVVIHWQDSDHNRLENRPQLLNLAPELPNFAVQFGQIIDFVPADDQAKAQARRRFAAARQMGLATSTHDLASQPF
ncbi:DNA polymerase III subunit chi [Ferrimonas lipolytica]|uniref:DNA polymerase III subunit chi n=1 Tax=Ferrimonas lipolytica TaxID=2724191 RepID=A0A6H1UHZ0_9GAMM|nr:DNA polymerase III subunit chi [Ferrimonas lipolytica]QIZ78701.1 DNA polymerase III subunit chi [Ferrimonas lipolytica]